MKCPGSTSLNVAMTGFLGIPLVKVVQIKYQFNEYLEIVLVICLALCLVFGTILYVRNWTIINSSETIFINKLHKSLLIAGGLLFCFGVLIKALLNTGMLNQGVLVMKALAVSLASLAVALITSSYAARMK